jgi:uncharacterized membrane-anchored protein YhcB (DUF1043 family)
MAKLGNTIATLLIGAAAGIAVGYVLATDKETRQEDLDKVKKSLAGLKDKFSKKQQELEDEIYHS